MGNGASLCEPFKAEDVTVAEISGTSHKSDTSIELPDEVVYVDVVSMGLTSYTSDALHQHDLVCANMAWRRLIAIQMQQRAFDRLFYGFLQTTHPQLAFLSQSIDFQDRFICELVRIMMLQLDHESCSFKSRVADFVQRNSTFGITIVDCK